MLPKRTARIVGILVVEPLDPPTAPATLEVDEGEVDVDCCDGVRQGGTTVFAGPTALFKGLVELLEAVVVTKSKSNHVPLTPLPDKWAVSETK